MPNNKMFIDHRKHKRFKVRDGVFAVLGKETPAIGQIKDFERSSSAIPICPLLIGIPAI